MDKHLREVDKYRISPPPTRGWTFQHFKDVLKLNRRLVVLTTVLMAALGACTHYLSKYQANSVLEFVATDNNPFSLNNKNGPAVLTGKSNEPIDRTMTFVKSDEFSLRAARIIRTQSEHRSVRDQLQTGGSFAGSLIGAVTGLAYERPAAESRDVAETLTLARKIRNSLKVKKNGENLELGYTSANPELAVSLANMLSEIAVNESLSEQMKGLDDFKGYLEHQIDLANGRLHDIDNELVEFKRRNNLLFIHSMDGAEDNANRLRAQLRDTRIKYHQNENLIQSLSDQLNENERRAFSGDRQDVSATELAQVRDSLEKMKYKKSLLLAQGFGESSGPIRELESEIERVSTNLRELIYRAGSSGAADSSSMGMQNLVKRITELRKENEGLRALIESVKTALQGTKESTVGLPEGEQLVENLKKRTDIEFDTYSELNKMLVAIQNQEAMVRSSVRVAERATLGGIAPRLALFGRMLLGALFGLLVAGVLIFEKSDRIVTVRFREEILAFGLDLIGSVPALPDRWFASFRGNLTVLRGSEEEPGGVALEILVRKIADHRIVAVVSARSGDGKSFLALNLARQLASSGKRVLLLDGDYFKQSLSYHLAAWFIPKGKGGRANEPEAFARKYLHSIGKNLDFVPATGFFRSRSQLLSGSKLRRFLDSMSASYDHVLIDTPNIKDHPDALAISAESDLLLLSVSYLVTPQKDLLQAVRKLEKLGHGQVKAVFNRVNLNNEYADLCSAWREARQDPGRNDRLSIVRDG